METVGHGFSVGPPRGGIVLAGLHLGRSLEGLGALIQIPVYLAALVFSPTHHAGPGEHGVMDGIRLDVATTAHEVDLDHNQVVYVVQVLTNALFRESRIATAEDEVPRGTNADLAGYMARQDELAIIPPS